MDDRRHRRLRHLLAACLVFAVAAIATPAFADSDLTGELPGGYDTVILVNFDQMRGSPLYDEAFDFLSNNPQARQMTSQLEDEFDIDVESDVEALAMVSNSPPLSSEMLDQPAEAVEDAARSQDGGSLILVRGNFDTRELLGQLSDGDEDSIPQTVSHNGVELRAVDENTLAVITGSPSFTQTAASRLDAERTGPGARFQRAIQQLGPSQGAYVMMEPSVQDGAMQDQMGAAASFAAASLDLGDGLRLGLLTELESEEGATSLVEEIDGLRGQAAENPAVQMFGFGPLVENLSVRQSGSEVTVRTSMNEQQAMGLAQQVRSILERQQQLGTPMEGDRLDDAGDDADDDTDTEAESSPRESDDVEDGVDADFN